jgi:hypothetical protein
MALSDRLRAKALEAAEKAKVAAADGAAKAAATARETLESSSDGAGPRLLALLRMDDEHPITLEALVVLLVDAVHKDGEARERSDRDVFKAAKRRYRRLGAVSLPTGPLGGHVVKLYCEAATLCDIVELRTAPLSDEEIAAHLLVLWGAMPDTTSATAAIDGSGPSVIATLALRGKDRLGLSAAGNLATKRAVITTLWRLRPSGLRGALEDAREAATPGIRENLFPGGRVKAFIAQAHEQLDAPARST